jgi:hypothetical protein
MERSVYEIRLFRGLVAVFALTLAVFDGRLGKQTALTIGEAGEEYHSVQLLKSENPTVEIFRRTYKDPAIETNSVRYFDKH